MTAVSRFLSRQALHRLGLTAATVVLAAGVSGCGVVAVAGATAGAAISVAGAVVSTGVKVTGKVIEKTIDAVTPAAATPEPTP